MGDFNSILSQEDRVGNKVTYAKIKEFKECVEQCGLQELKSSGCFYTWSNKQQGHDRVPSRIDRVITNNDWVNKLPASKVLYMPAGVYDHSHAMIKWEGTCVPKMRIFRYYNMWSMDNSFMTRLNKDKFSEVEKHEDESMKKLVECQEKIQNDPRNETLGKKEKELTKKYIYWKEAKLNYLQKKSKVQ
ncbi:uncharacterized protein [Nicotiana tomentosiformis]|uniref:uncharacterized protein n=1 Tax=Nicotiana tomentosiformis TaxID=4098 RepID=UPI00388CDFCF